MKKIYYDEMKNNIDKLIKDGRLNQAAVFVFGHCDASENMIDYLIENGICVTAILDNNEYKWGMSYKSAIVHGPIIIQSYNASKSIVLIATKAYEAMAGQLRSLGYGGDICRVAEYNSFAEFSLAEDTFQRKRQRMLRGAETLRKIRETYPSQFLVICPYDALGDVYQALSFLPEYCRKHGVRDNAVIVEGNVCRQVAEMFGAKNPVALDKAAMDELVQAVLFMREGNCIIAHHDRPYTNNIIRYLDKHFLSFADFYRCGVYGLGKDAKPALPKRQKAFNNALQMEKNNSVILSPHAKSMVRLPEPYWEALADDYRQNGYFVCTNVAGDEKPVKGTQPLRLPIDQMVSAAEYAGLFIGLRSGLCDIISAAKCRKIVVFPDCFYSTTGVKVDQFFDMPGWEKRIYKPSE